nr:hypothetical protein [Tanacetum cinerariifolium]
MSFGLKNAGATYQRLVDTTFQSQIGRNLDTYVDDMVIKSNNENAIADMKSPRTLKEMRSLSGKLAALKRFLPRSAERSLPFFETLKDITKENKDEYLCTKSAEKAFQEMKKVIFELSLLTIPIKKETLYVYVAAATEAILNKAQASGKLAKYSVELGAYSITYEPRNAMKGQVLADFLSDGPVGTPTEEFFRYRPEVLVEQSTNQKEVGAIIEEEEDNWMTPIICCLAEGVWPKDKDERRSHRMKINQIRRERAGWVNELPNVLWAHRTSLKQSNGETPFSLTYGSKAVIPAEIGMPTHRTMMIREDKNEDVLPLNMDLL